MTRPAACGWPTVPEPAPPFRPGDRVRCVVRTVEDLRGRELLGRVGTVDRCLPVGDVRDRGWDVTVVWDGLLPRMLAHHDPERLEMAGAR